MKRQRLTQVRQKIYGAVIAGIEVKFVFDVLCLKFPVEFRSSFLKPEFILLAAVEIDRQP